MEIARLELATFRLSVECSNQLSYISKEPPLRFELRTSILPRLRTTPVLWRQWERLDLNQCRLSQRFYRPPPLTTRTLSRLPRVRGRGRPFYVPQPTRPRSNAQTLESSPGSRGGRTRTSQFQAVCLTCYRSFHYPRCGGDQSPDLPK